MNRPDAASPMRRDNIADLYPLSPMQEGILFHALFQAVDDGYFRQLSCRMDGPLDEAALEEAWRRVVEANPILRTAFLSEGVEQPMQVVLRRLDLPFHREDWRGLDEAVWRRHLEDFLEADRQRGFRPDEPPLLRLALLRVEDGVRYLVWSFHHLLLDGWSLSLLLGDVFRGYRSRLAGEAPAPTHRRPYRDYIAWLRQRDLGEAERYWRRVLAGFAAPTPVEPEGGVEGAGPGELEHRLDADSTAALETLARTHGLTLNTFVQGAWGLLLARYAASREVVFGATVSGRPTDLPGFDEMVGLFINTLPVRVAAPPEASLLPWLRRLQEAGAEARNFEFSPLSRVQRWSDVPAGTPLFETLMAFENFPVDEALQRQPEGGLELSDVRHPDATNYPLTLIAAPGPRLYLRLLYDGGRFSAAAVRRRLRYLANLLAAMAERPEARLGELPLMDDAERSAVLGAWKDRRAAFPVTRLLHERFADRAAEHPEAPAVTFRGTTLDYGEVSSRMGRLARRLRAAGVGPEVRVGIFLERSADLVVAILAVLEAGGTYVPLDPDYPEERLAFILGDAGAPLVLSEASLVDRLPTSGVRVLTLDDGSEPAAAEDAVAVPAPVDPDHAAYLIYTSGSTGKPKGVLVTHRNAARLFDATDEWFGFGANDVWTLFHSPAFDFSVWELWGALAYGGRLVVVPYLTSRSPEDFHRLLADEGVTVLNQTPSAFRQLVAADAGTAGLPALRRVVFGGEALDPVTLRPWYERRGDGTAGRGPRLVNMFGITETTVHVTGRPLDAADAGRGGSVIGGPIPDLRLHVLDRRLEPVPPGVAGELFVGGAGLARGYLDRPGLTADRFVPDPFAGGGERLYRTGDLARYLARDGEDGGAVGELDVEYLGRIDHQVKVRGFRIELGEIEAALEAHPGVGRAVVLARGEVEKRLLAWFVAAGEAAPPVAELREHLSRTLPEYMVPAAFVPVEAIPLTAHGKLDRRALPDPTGRRADLGTADYAPPRNDQERILATAWEEVLGVERVGIHDSFFALGGDSIRSIQVRSLAEERGVPFTLPQLFANPTIAELAASLDGGDAGGLPAAVPATEPFALVDEEQRRRLPTDAVDAYPLSRLQAGMVFHTELNPASSAYRDVFSYELEAPFDETALRTALDRLGERHPVLRTSYELGSFDDPLQVVHAAAPIPLVVDGLLDGGAAPSAAGLVDEERRRPYEWSRPPLLRVRVVRLVEDRFHFVLAFHHSILDGWSVALLLDELFRLYLGVLGMAVEPPGAPPRVAFRDFVAAERAALEDPAAAEFWQRVVGDEDLDLLPRWPGAEPPGTPGRRRPVELPESLGDALQGVARRADVPLKSVLLAAHLAVLARLTGKTSAVSGVVSHGRSEEGEGERVAGLFLNTLPLRVELPAGSWLELVRRAFDAEREALPFRLYPLAEVVRRRGGRPPFEATFNYVHFHPVDGLRGLSGVRLHGVEGYEETNYPLTANFRTTGGGLELTLSYHPAELPEAQVERLAAYYRRALEAMAADPDASCRRAPDLDPAEAALLAAWNDTAEGYGTLDGEPFNHRVPLHVLVARRAAEVPDAVAVRRGGETLTYDELVVRAERLADLLADYGVGLESPVGLHLDRSFEQVVAILAALIAGGTYVPLDPAYPAQRLADVVEQVEPVLILTTAAGRDALPALPAATPVLEVDRPLPEAAAAPRPEVAPDNLAYVLFTSGSSGRPKGVMIPHGAIANRLLWMQRDHPLETSDRVLLKTPFGFDASVWELFVPLLAGAQVVLAEPGAQQDPAYLAREVRERGVTVLQLVPSLLGAFLEHPETAELPSLRRLFCGGEALPVDAVRSVEERLGCELVNLYGPTEVAIDATSMPCLPAAEATRRAGEEGGTAPIGRPLANVRVHLLDRAGRRVPLGTPGELCVAGAGLARGYHGDPRQTAERFVPDPFAPEPGGRLYRTGDRARWRPDGVLDFLGRLDQQVKLRGVRIEPGEVEALLRSHAGVREAVVVVREDRPGDRRLVAYAEVGGGAEGLKAALWDHLKEHLPTLMLPAALQLLDRLPRTPSGKLDRRALPSPEAPEAAEHVAPRNPVEEKLVEIWQEVLGVGGVGVEDDFFALGGHSLLALQVIARVRNVFSVELPLGRLFESPTVAHLAVLTVELLMDRIEEMPEDEVERLLGSIGVG